MNSSRGLRWFLYSPLQITKKVDYFGISNVDKAELNDLHLGFMAGANNLLLNAAVVNAENAGKFSNENYDWVILICSNKVTDLEEKLNGSFSHINTIGLIPHSRPRLAFSLLEKNRINLKSILMFHSPGRLTAKLILILVSTFPFFIASRFFKKNRIVIYKRKNFSSVVESLVKNYYEISDHSLYFGVDGIHSKIVSLLTFKNGKKEVIKIGSSSEARSALQNEVASLLFAKEYELKKHIPYVIDHGQYGKSIFYLRQIYIQRNLFSSFQVNGYILSFLRKMSNINREKISINFFISKIEDADKGDLIEYLKSYNDKYDRPLTHVYCSFSHGDFAPWNVCVSGRDLYVYDWECAASQRNILFDLFYFYLSPYMFPPSIKNNKNLINYLVSRAKKFAISADLEISVEIYLLLFLYEVKKKSSFVSKMILELLHMLELKKDNENIAHS